MIDDLPESDDGVGKSLVSSVLIDPHNECMADEQGSSTLKCEPFGQCRDEIVLGALRVCCPPILHERDERLEAHDTKSVCVVLEFAAFRIARSSGWEFRSQKTPSE